MYLSEDGQYYGFDILKSEINWCNKKYKSYSNFSFDSFSIKNDLYLTNADQEAKDFVFPYEANSFDYAILISVFTHMQVGAVENYIDQISKVLKPGGLVYASFFLTDEDKDYPLFPHSYDKFCLHNSRVKNANVAFRRDYISDLANLHALEIVSEETGWWSNGKIDNHFDFQDILVFRKK